jgi:uncharacterized phage infection (PIP) family protein YhgE
MATKVSAAAKKPQSFTVRKAADLPAPADTIDLIRADAAKLSERLCKLSVKKQAPTSADAYAFCTANGLPALKPPIVATKGQAKLMVRLIEVDSELAEMTANLAAERAKIKAELDSIVDSAESSAIVAESVGLQYTAEPSKASVTVKLAGMSHHIRAIPK